MNEIVFYEDMTNEDPYEYGIEIGLDFELCFIRDVWVEDGYSFSDTRAEFERVPRLNINGVLVDLPKEVLRNIEEIIIDRLSSKHDLD